MKLNWICVVIVTTYSCCIKASDFTNEDGVKCLVAYLQQKGKLEIEFPIKPSSHSNCRIFTPATLKQIESKLIDKIKEEQPSDVDCAIREMKNQGIMDSIVKVYVLGNSSLSESNFYTQIVLELGKTFIKIMYQCETGEDSVLAIYDQTVNETVPALGHDYCFAKYAKDNALLPLQDIELNPDGIDTTLINCNGVIEKERQEHERNRRTAVASRDSKTINCVIDVHHNKHMVNNYITKRVLNYVHFPKEIKDQETNKINAQILDASAALTFCLVNEEFEANKNSIYNHIISH